MVKVTYDCSTCMKKCCDRTGYVYLILSEVEKISSYSGLDRKSFSQTIINPYIESEIRVLMTPCIFFDKIVGKCTIENVKPLFCRFYPFFVEPLSLNVIVDDRCTYRKTENIHASNIDGTTFELYLDEIETWLYEFFKYHKKSDSHKIMAKKILMQSLRENFNE